MAMVDWQVTLTGTPGVGKSVFASYLVLRCMQPEVSVSTILYRKQAGDGSDIFCLLRRQPHDSPQRWRVEECALSSLEETIDVYVHDSTEDMVDVRCRLRMLVISPKVGDHGSCGAHSPSSSTTLPPVRCMPFETRAWSSTIRSSGFCRHGPTRRCTC